MKMGYGSSHKKSSTKGNAKAKPTPGNASGGIGTRHWGNVKGSVTSKKYG